MDYKTILRHYLATLAYRTGVAIDNVTEEYIDFNPGNDAMTPKQIMLHMVQLVRYPNYVFNGDKFLPFENENWKEIVNGFYDNLRNLDKTIEQLDETQEQNIFYMFQGPICDAMTHVGQLMMIHRLMGKPRQAKPYYKVDIKIGKFEYDYTED